MHSIVILLCALSCSKHSSQVIPADDPLKSNEHDLVRIVAHRGFWRADKIKPTANSIASLRSAQEYHLWGSEFDVRLTSDSIPIVYHDDSINGLRIIDTPLEVLSTFKLPNGEGIPSLDAFLAEASKDSSLVLVMELKWQYSAEMDSILIDKCIESLNQHNLLYPHRVIFISFSPDICQRIVQLLPEYTVQALFTNMSLDDLHEMGIKGIDYHRDIIISDLDIINNAHRLGMGVNVWTVDDKELLNKLIISGVDYITTDDPMLIRSSMLEVGR